MFPKEGDDTWKRILSAARALFAEFGFNGTSVRDIASAAKVNLGAIGYYFTTKELLYLHLLQEIVGPLAPRIEWCTRGDQPPLVKIERAVRAIFQHIRENPDMPAFMVRELAGRRPPSEPILQTLGRVAPALAGVITEGQRRGEIREGNPFLFVMSIIAQPVHLFLGRNAIAAIAGINIEDDDPHIVDHCVAVVHAGLATR